MEWNAHKPGPCPADPDSLVEVVTKGGYSQTGRAAEFPMAWRDGSIAKWRYATKPDPISEVKKYRDACRGAHLFELADNLTEVIKMAEAYRASK